MPKSMPAPGLAKESVKNLLAILDPAKYAMAFNPKILGTTTAGDRTTILMPAGCVTVGGALDFFPNNFNVNINDPGNWDNSSYAVAAARAGIDFYIYALAVGGIILSANATVPTGYSAGNSRKIGGWHCLCLSVGTISGHKLTGFTTGDILPQSVWGLDHRPVCYPKGMVYLPDSGLWVDIYLMSGTGSNTESAYNATITDTRDWMDFVDDLGSVGKRLLTDYEFQCMAAGCNEETNIAGSVDPGTTGGHIDTGGRRMISNIGCEDCAGVMYQWLLDQSYQVTGFPDTGDPSWSWYNLPGAKGSLYMQGSAGDAKLRAGGNWSYGSHCGSRCRYANYSRWYSSSNIGGRGCARGHRA